VFFLLDPFLKVGFVTPLMTIVCAAVDGGNPAPPGMYETLKMMGIFSISTG